MKCRHCDAPKANRRFNIQLCCEGRKKRSIWLCEKCDAELQRRIVRFLHLESRQAQRREGKPHADWLGMTPDERQRIADWEALKSGYQQRREGE